MNTAPLSVLDRLERQHFAWISIAAAVATIALKAAAWWLTGSVGLLSDALESFVNLAGASFALWMILITRRPPDDDHPFGHGKAEYFSSGFEGILIFGAAVAIIGTGIERLISPLPLESLGVGLAVSALATAINFAVAVVLRRAGRRLHSVALDADARHLMTDVITSVGVVFGVALVALTGWQRLDPLIAIAVGVHILVEGGRLLRGAVDGLMDRSLEPAQQAELQAVLDAWAPQGVLWRHLRTRRAGTQAWVHAVVQVPGAWSVQAAHEVLTQMEQACARLLPQAKVILQLEPVAMAQPAPYADTTVSPEHSAIQPGNKL